MGVIPRGRSTATNALHSPAKAKKEEAWLFSRNRDTARMDAPEEELPVESVLAYQQRLAELIKRSANGKDVRARLRILL